MIIGRYHSHGYVSLYVKKDFAGVIKFPKSIDLEIERLLRWTLSDHISLLNLSLKMEKDRNPKDATCS